MKDETMKLDLVDEFRFFKIIKNNGSAHRVKHYCEGEPETFLHKFFDNFKKESLPAAPKTEMAKETWQGYAFKTSI